MTCAAKIKVRSHKQADQEIELRCQRDDPHPGALHGAGGADGSDYYTIAWGPANDAFGAMSYGD